MMQAIAFILFELIRQVGLVSSSSGDREIGYVRCLGACVSETCSPSMPIQCSVGLVPPFFAICCIIQLKCSFSLLGNLEEFYKQQGWALYLFSWGCEDECRYNCMWQRVNTFLRDGAPIPQYHGKVMGSHLFSLS